MLYDKIRKIAQEKGISITALEQKANLSNGAIGKWKNSEPTVGKIKAVAEVLEVKLEELIG